MIKKNMIVICFIVAICLMGFLYKGLTQGMFTYTPNVSIVNNQIIQNDISINYPEFSNLNQNDDKIINDLIKDYLHKLVEQKKISIFKEYNLYLNLNYEIKYFSDNFISICFMGSEGVLNNVGRGFGLSLYAINIDVKQAEIVDVEDIIVQYNSIYELLAQDKFESITTIEGIKGGYYFSSQFNSPDQEDGLEGSNLKYYITEEKLVLVISGGRQYYEYAININNITEYLNKDILSKIKKY